MNPLSALDPHQIRSVRQLIKGLAGKHTVLISTHILPEAEMTCNRMLIMFDGRILAADTPENLQKLMSGNSQIRAEIAAPLVELNEYFMAHAEVEHFNLSPADGNMSGARSRRAKASICGPQIFSLVRERGWACANSPAAGNSLEDIYLQVTKPEEEEKN